MTTENGKELGGHHCPDWDGLWVTPSSPEHEACTCYIGPTMTTNKPEVVAFYHANKTNPGIRGVTLSHDPSWANVYESTEPLIRLSDYETLQAEFVIRLDELSARNYELRMGLAEKTSECEELRKDAEQQPAPDVSELVETLTMARETIAFALRKNAPDHFTTDADIARHVDIQRIDSALADHRKGGEV